MRRFSGKTVIVTGSGRANGLGQAILHRFAQEGANCVVSDLGVPKQHMEAGDIGNNDEMEQIASELKEITKQHGGDVSVIACDVTKDADCKALIEQAHDRFGSVDILVNNAGIGYIMKPLIETEDDEWSAVLDVNLGGAFRCSKYAARMMIADGIGGSIINIASQAAKSGFPHMAPYTSSKHGMIGLTRSNAVELAEHKIRVNAVCPNHVTTGLGERQNAYFSDLLGFENVDAYLDAMRGRIPLGRPGLPSDTAAACAWLASEDAVFVTGEALNVSGGEDMH